VVNYSQVAPPVFSPVIGSYTVNPLTITLSTPTSGAVIKYTTDGRPILQR